MLKRAVISVSDKTHLKTFANRLLQKHDAVIYSTGGTYDYLSKHIHFSLSNYGIHSVDRLTFFPEILSGRVKTLHPSIMGGILADKKNSHHQRDLKEHHIRNIDLVVANLYPFKKVANDPNKTRADVIENIDIGGHTMVRAAAKNYENVCVLIDPEQYDEYIERSNKDELTIEYRRELAVKAFQYISEYDADINNFFNDDSISLNLTKQTKLKYGLNPSNVTAGIYCNGESTPFDILNGNIGYINVLDAIGSWRLVSEAKLALGDVCCSSFKHTIPAGVALGDGDKTALVDVYKRARGIDPLSSFGDFIAISGKVDVETAKYVANVVSDGIIAEDYEDEALVILKRKKLGKFVVLKGREIDFNSKDYDIKKHFNTTLVQSSDNYVFNKSILNNYVTQKSIVHDIFVRDMILASIAIKYAQSNSVSLALNGQVIGIGSGQQNRLDCVRLACEKALMWCLRHDSEVNKLFKTSLALNKKISPQERLSLFYKYIRDDLPEDVKARVQKEMRGVSLSSDGFIPFSDNIDEAVKYGVSHIVNPGGSTRDADVIKVCDKYGLVMAHTGKRLFFH